jgi:hypothetical protein
LGLALTGALHLVVYLVLLPTFVFCLLPVALFGLGVGFGLPSLVETAKELSPFVAPLVALGATSAAVHMAYKMWLSPFAPVVHPRIMFWRLGPGAAPGWPIGIVIYITAFNDGATPGVINNLFIRIDLPKGQWFLEALLFVKPAQFYQSLFKKEIKSPFDFDVVEGPFTPIVLSAREPVTKAILFTRGLGHKDFDGSLFEPGLHDIRLFSQFDILSTPTEIYHGKINFDAELIANLRDGKTITGEVRTGDRAVRELLPG